MTLRIEALSIITLSMTKLSITVRIVKWPRFTLCLMILRIMSLSIITLKIIILSIVTFRIMALSLITLVLTKLSIIVRTINMVQVSDLGTLDKCAYAWCHHTECHGAIFHSQALSDKLRNQNQQKKFNQFYFFTLLHYLHRVQENLIQVCKTGGVYNKTLPICNVRKMDIFQSKLVFSYCHSLSLTWTNKLAYFGIHKL